jgi:UDP-N-acetylglucosamine 2-epimerase
MIALLVGCVFTLTDSGGIQEEASAFGKPVLVARKSTERQELVHVGGACLVGTEVATITQYAIALLSDADFYRTMQVEKSPFGDGHSARSLVDVLAETQQQPAPARLLPVEHKPVTLPQHAYEYA